MQTARQSENGIAGREGFGPRFQKPATLPGLRSLNVALYRAAGRWQSSAVRSLLFLSLCAALVASCASPEKETEEARKTANSRVVESQRMNALNNNGWAGSDRWSEVAVIDPDKSFEMKNMSTGSGKTFNTGSANVKEFNYDQKMTTKSYASRGFWGAKQSAFSDQRFATRAARTSGSYEIPNATKKADTKTAATKEAREADMAMAVRTLPDGSRQYLGKEKDKMKTPVDPKEAANWRGASAMVTTGGEVGASTGGRRYITPVEQIGQMKEISIEDLRELLNKNK